MSDVYVHPTAVVDEGAELGEGVKVWHFGHVMGGAKIGEGTSLGQGCFVASGATIGARVKVQNHVSIHAGVEIEDDVFIGPSAVFTNVENPRAFVDRKAEFLPTRVRRGATIGANAVVVCGHVIGEYAFVGAGAVVTHDVPAHALVVGNPARRIGWVSRRGHRLADGASATCPETGETYEIDGESCTLVERAPVAGVDPAARAVGAARDRDVPAVDLAELHRPMTSELTAAFTRVLRSGRYILGREVSAFEREAARRLGVEHAVGMSSGSDALVVALAALGIGVGDEVVTTPYSFFATVEAILRLGATPRFVDLEPSGFHVDANALAASISARTRAVLAVHLFGSTCGAEVFDVAAARSIPVVEDAAQAFGARFESGQAAGARGIAGGFSFFPTKTLGALGDGGLFVTNDASLAREAAAIRAHGSRRRYHHDRVGGNYRLDELQAAFLRTKLRHFDVWAARRRAIARLYGEFLGALPGGDGPSAIELPRFTDRDTALHYVVRTPLRDELRAHLAEERIATEIYYPEPLNVQPALGDAATSIDDVPRAARACREALALPIHPALDDRSVGRVAAAILAWARERA